MKKIVYVATKKIFSKSKDLPTISKPFLIFQNNFGYYQQVLELSHMSKITYILTGYPYK